MEVVESASTTTTSVLLGVVLCGVLTLFILQYKSFYWLKDAKSGAGLPKGSFGWPIIGESLALLRDPLEFAISHKKRYGSIFKSNVFLQKAILGTSPEFARFIANSRVFKVSYPESVQFISPNFFDGPFQDAVKTCYRKLTLPQYLKTMFQALESIILDNLASWEEQGTVLGSEACEKLVADTSSFVALGVKNIQRTSEGRLAVESMFKMVEGFGAIPINLPGTAYNKSLKAREDVRSYMKSILEKIRNDVGMEVDTHFHILRSLLEEKAGGSDAMKFYDDDSMIDDMVGAWVGGFKTVSVTLKWTLKVFVDYPEVFSRIQAEQQEILEGKDLSVAGPRLLWEDLKKMEYTTKVFQEVQRTMSIAYMNMRKATEDIVYDGFLIPKGWVVLPLITYVHHDPANYEDQDSFNPDRFNIAPKPNTYIPFGMGSHRCPGAEIAKIIFLIHTHYLATTYKYERVGPDRGTKIVAGFAQLVGGYPINFSRRT